jgi:alpha-D-ribose 1-methylphosphonate 5-triphosphate synthase subunit PhnH
MFRVTIINADGCFRSRVQEAKNSFSLTLDANLIPGVLSAIPNHHLLPPELSEIAASVAVLLTPHILFHSVIFKGNVIVTLIPRSDGWR